MSIKNWKFRRSLSLLLITLLLFSQTAMAAPADVSESAASDTSGESINEETTNNLPEVSEPDTESETSEQPDENISDSEDLAEDIIDDNSAADIVDAAATTLDISLYSDSVHNVAQLQAAISAAVDGATITLADDFTFAPVSLSLGNAEITIDGRNLTWSTGALTLTGSGSKTATIKNLQFGAAATRAISINTAVPVILDNISIRDRAAGAEDGAAINVAGNGNATIRNCSFIDNTVGWSGYSGGAIASKGLSGNLSIENCLFQGNKNLVVGSVLGGQGGAIYLYNVTGNVNITDCYFLQNEAVKDVSGVNAQLADGGAVAIFDIKSGATLNISNSTFSENVAGDDGGAILIQTLDTITSGLSVTNCTFYKNEAQGLETTFYNGGAIQVYGNRSGLFSTWSYVDITNNTFYGNIAHYYGGAVAQSSRPLSTTRSWMTNNIFIDNESSNANFNNVCGNDGTYNLGGNIGYDNGTASTDTKDQVFGVYTISLSDNLSSVQCGYEADQQVIPTLPIKPDGTADNIVTSAPAVTTDQRHYTRSASSSDSGATEIGYIKFNAGDGHFNPLVPQTEYTGEEYQLVDSGSGKIKDIYRIAGLTTPLIESMIPEQDGLEFKGWSTTNNGSVLSDADLADLLNNTTESRTLYAIFGPFAVGTVVVSYLDENGTPLTGDISMSGTVGSSYTTEQKAFTGYTFKEVIGEQSGTYSSTAKTVTYHYKKNGTLGPGNNNNNNQNNNQNKTPDKTSSVKKKVYKTPMTGDSSNSGMLMILILLSVFAGGTAFYISDQKKKKKS